MGRTVPAHRWPEGAAVARWKLFPDQYVEICGVPYVGNWTNDLLVTGHDVHRGPWTYCRVDSIVPLTELARELLNAPCEHKKPRRRYVCTRCKRCNAVIEQEYGG